MRPWVWTLASVLLVSALSLIGLITLSLKKERLDKTLLLLVSFAVGGLFGDAFIHLLPESFERLGINLMTSVYVVVGILIFFVIEKFLRWRHCHAPTSLEHLHPVVTLNLVGDGIHNLIDGMIIGASYLISIPIGIATTLAVIFHEIPQEIGDFGVLLHGGLSVPKALFFNFCSALAAVVGAVISLVIGPYIKGYAAYLLPITAGGFIYIAGSDLIPELHQRCDVKISATLLQFLFICLGVSTMVILALLGG